MIEVDKNFALFSKGEHHTLLVHKIQNLWNNETFVQGDCYSYESYKLVKDNAMIQERADRKNSKHKIFVIYGEYENIVPIIALTKNIDKIGYTGKPLYKSYK